MELPDKKIFFKPIHKNLLSAALLSLICIVTWYGITDVKFLNDDFQITGWNEPQSFAECFSPFSEKDVSGFYYRPVPNTIHSLNKYFFGNDPYYFRLANLLIYIGIINVLAFFLLKLGIGRIESLIASVLFALLPSHEYILGWIAVIGDTLVLLFSLLAAINFLSYIKEKKFFNLLISIIFFIFACFSKEGGFFGIFIPFIFLIIKPENYSPKSAIKYFVIFSFIALTILFFRQVSGLDNIFESPNLRDTNILEYIYNFVLFLLLSFVTPDTIEKTFHGMLNADLLSLVIISTGIASIIIMIISFKNMKMYKKRIFFFGLTWFFVFIIPGIPLMMQWYVYTASGGLLISLSTFIEFDKKKTPGFILTILILVFSVLSFFNSLEVIYNYKIAANKTNQILTSLRNIEIKNGQRLVVWGSPDKINRVNTLKIGLQQAVEQFSEADSIDVYAPLRTEHFVGANISAKIIEDNKLEFSINKGRFLSASGRSRAYFIDEDLIVKSNGVILEISNRINDNNPAGTVTAKFRSTQPNDIHIYYTGEKFEILK